MTKSIVVAMLSSLMILCAAVANAAPAKPTAAKASKSEEGDGLIKVAVCRDGREYWAPTNEHRGACSGHGGVASWADGSPVKAGKTSRYR